MKPGSAWHFLATTPCLSGLRSAEFPDRPASNSERRRWLVNRAVVVNGERPGPDDTIERPIESLVLFPKGNRRITLV